MRRQAFPSTENEEQFKDTGRAHSYLNEENTLQLVSFSHCHLVRGPQIFNRENKAAVVLTLKASRVFVFFSYPVISYYSQSNCR